MPPATAAVCTEPPCPAGIAIADPDAHRQWHEEQRVAFEAGAPLSELTVADVIVGWLDELDPDAVEQLVLSEAPSMGDSAVAGTIAVLKKMAKGET